MRFQRILKMRHLLLIRTLGAELNLRRCAEILNTSQPAISRTLIEIEEQLGEKLFERTTRSVTPTQVGLSLIWHAQRVLGDLEQAEADFNALVRGATQVLHVGVLSGFAPTLLGRAISEFVQRCPDVELRLHEGLAADLFISLRHDRVNMILSHVDVPRDDEDIIAEVIYRETIAVVVSPAHPLAKRRRLSLSDLGTQRWLLPPVGTTIRIAMERELLLSAGGRLPPIVESTGPHFTAAMLKCSTLLAAVPQQVAYWLEQDCGVAKTLKVQTALPTWPVCVARYRTRAVSFAASEFIDCMRTVATDHISLSA
jgi:DNA-binding transcriptional LysR family regulator